MVRKGGLEPPRSCERQPLKLVRLPIPPLPQKRQLAVVNLEAVKKPARPLAIGWPGFTAVFSQLVSRHSRQNSPTREQRPLTADESTFSAPEAEPARLPWVQVL